MSEESRKKEENIIKFQKLENLGEDGKNLGDLLRTEFKSKPPKIDFTDVESFVVLLPIGNFLHNTNYIKDPLFLDAINGTISAHVDDEEGDENPEHEVTEVTEVTVTVRLAKNSKGEIIGIICKDSDLPDSE